MEALEVMREFGKEFDALFSNPMFSQTPFIERGYTMDTRIAYGGVLFIGLNPSYRKGSLPGNSFYDLEEIKADQYFKKFWVIANECKLPCAHLDILALRETSSKKVEPHVKTHSTFIVESLSLSKRIMERSKPKVIVVVDSVARRLIGKDGSPISMGYKFSSLRADCTYRITNPESSLTNVPVFFSGMLSGQRALDNGSFERLRWHVKNVVENKFLF